MIKISKTLFFTLTVILGIYACKKEDKEIKVSNKLPEETPIDSTTKDSIPVVIVPTCSDGILNQDEEEIDCGGVCEACALSARDSAFLDYKNNYLGSEVLNLGWTGNISNCDEGTVPQEVHDKVIQRINYFRRLVGLNDDCSMNEDKHSMYQKTALLMVANGDLDHTPPESWDCWSQEAYDGARTSNLSLSWGYDYHSVYAVTGQIEDAGNNNIRVGHRRWILYSRAYKFAHGSTNNSMSLGVISMERKDNIVPEFIAYPPADFMPQTLVFDRWSFAIPSADFSNAIVQMQDAEGNQVGLTVVSNDALNIGDNTIVWEPQNIDTQNLQDLEYTVTITGISNAPETSYTYTVTIISVSEPAS